MTDRFKRASREEECKQLLAAYEANRFEIVKAIESQFNTLHNRAQVLLAICGVLLTSSVMLMTGKLIGGPDLPHLSTASRFMIVGGASDILAAVVAVGGVLRIRWESPPGRDLHSWVMTRLVYRDRKTRALHISITLLMVAMLLHQVAATIVLVKL